MNKKQIILPLLAMAITAGISAQTKENDDIIIHRKGNAQQKTTIVIDGKNITVNGKPVDQWKDGSIEIVQADSNSISFNLPEFQQQFEQMFGPNSPRGGVQFFRRMGPVNAHLVNKAQLGVITQKAENETGAAVKEVKTGTPAEKAGLQPGDIIQKINNNPIQNSEDLYKAIGQFKPGDTVTISYVRNGVSKTTQAVLQKNQITANENQWGEGTFNFQMPPIPEVPEFNFRNMNKKPMLGVQIEEMENNAGVKINSVNPNSPAEKAGIEKGDVVTTIDGNTVKSIEDIKQVMNSKKEGDAVSLTYLRDGKKHNTTIVFPKTIKKATL
ncbi:MAG: PDZ domain-containing protein [Sphingobacteriales bacterium]|uniref:PDZ domain-containing protein n=1 Tax=Hydrotalea flava TaxID=714549 RepID=UPI000835A325|nr:PDZ domain-containing protein [Hydrotalea flava]RTL47287.1 MAG: PDZ domain-containing protein [Sphingobacteriales bacterium]